MATFSPWGEAMEDGDVFCFFAAADIDARGSSLMDTEGYTRLVHTGTRSLQE